MIIAYDAKRAYHNSTGLGVYSRTLINAMARLYPSNTYYLCNPKPSNFYTPNYANVIQLLPTKPLHKLLTGLWRSKAVVAQLLQHGVQLYHGLSHEIPYGIHRTNIKSIVTIHDLIHERYPKQYSSLDVKIYTKKFTYACKYATHIIAISQQTKQDIIHYYGINPTKITVCYQSCNPAFSTILPTQERVAITSLYHLPAQYLLSVGSIIERKNLLTLCKAMLHLPSNIAIPLVVIGNGGSYYKQVQQYITANALTDKIIFLSHNSFAKQNEQFNNATHFPAIYQGAKVLLYPSIFEGFGIPILEAISSGVPVITSNISSMPEAAGSGQLLINPTSVSEIATAITTVLSSQTLRNKMKTAGLLHASKFTNDNCTADVAAVYSSVVA